MTDSVLPLLFSERLRLRALLPDDAPALLALYGDPDVMRYWIHAPWTTTAQALAAIEAARTELAVGTALHLAIETRIDTRLAGSCALYDIDGGHRRATLGFLLGRGFWRLGYGVEAIGLLAGHGFATLGLRRIEAEVDVRNHASARLLARLGFQREGRMRARWLVDGERRDVDMWALLGAD